MLLQAGGVADGCYRLDSGVKAGQKLGRSVSSFVSSEQRLLDFSVGTGLSTPQSAGVRHNKSARVTAGRGGV